MILFFCTAVRRSHRRKLRLVMTTHHRTPLRRVSRGSLSAVSRSHNDSSAPAGLSFLGPVLEILTDELDALTQNVEGLKSLASTLEQFNESFASYLFTQKVNVFCVEWFEVSEKRRGIIH